MIGCTFPEIVQLQTFRTSGHLVFVSLSVFAQFALSNNGRMGCTDDIAETYFALAQQSPLGWSNEIDIRPFQETCRGCRGGNPGYRLGDFYSRGRPRSQTCPKHYRFHRDFAGVK